MIFSSGDVCDAFYLVILGQVKPDVSGRSGLEKVIEPEYFWRVLHKLEAESLITIEKRDVRVLHVQGLAHYGSHSQNPTSPSLEGRHVGRSLRNSNTLHLDLLIGIYTTYGVFYFLFVCRI